MTDKFRTVVEPGKYESLIDVGSRVFLTGSCFTDHIGGKFREHRLSAMVNPFGVLYNPFSIAGALERVTERSYCHEEELVHHNGLWHHFDFHGQFSHESKKSVCHELNKKIDEACGFLGETDFLVLTFGTARVFEYIENNRIVANCHKIPADRFNHYRLEPDEIVALYKELIVSLRVFNPSLKIIFTVSPVRHWKDGAHANQLSKSVLHLAVDKLCNLFEGVWYFPAYEIMMDELRDYRFYDDSMFNPSPLAVNYIWERFSGSLLTSAARQFAARAVRISKARNHRHSGKEAESYVRFLQNTLLLIREIEQQFPDADLSDDRGYFESLLNEQHHRS
ncbi:MAG: GSCFA domain-containing protein [Marinilabiliaceae bacterium]